MDKEQIKEKAGDIIDGIKEKFECDEHEDCDGIHLDDRIAEKVKEIIKNNEGKGSILDRDTWGMIAIVYIGGQSVIDAAKTWRHGG